MRKHKIIFLMILLYIIGISGYGYYSYLKSKKNIISNVDNQLKSTAFAINFILDDRYHNQIIDKRSISKDYFIKNAQKLTNYAKLVDVEYLYTFIKSDDKIRFISSSFTDEDIRANQVTKYFDPYEEASATLKRSFTTQEILFEESSDKWGTFRSVFIPFKVDNQTFVAGADIRVRHIDSLVTKAFLDAIITALFFLSLMIPIILLYIRNIENEKKHLEKVIENKTSELQIINHDLKNLSTQLSKYLSPQLYNSIFTNKQEVKIGSKRKKLTIFFSDIKDFTKATDHLEPEDMTYILNSYLNEMSQIALKYGATIDKFIGDAILIFFGDPESKGVQEDALLCVSMAIEMKAKMEELRQRWQKEGISQPFKIRMGINTGYCTVGNFGSEDKLDYTIIGNNVNLANRLENSAQVNEILISEETYLLLKDQVRCIKKDTIDAKGFDKPIATYQVNDNFKRNIIEERDNGFTLSLDLDHKDINKEHLVHLLESTLNKLKKCK